MKTRLKYRPPRSVRSRPARLEPVGVGDVGEERRPDQVDAGADAAGAGAAVPAAGRVAEFVDRGGGGEQGEHGDHAGRVAQGLPEPCAEAVDGEDPPVEGGGDGDDGGDDRRAEQRAQQGAGDGGGAFGQQGAAGLDGQQLAGGRGGGGGAVGGEDAERGELVRDEVAGLAGGQRLAQAVADLAGDGLRAAGAVEGGSR